MRFSLNPRSLAPKARYFALWTMSSPQDLARRCQRSLDKDGSVVWKLDGEPGAPSDHLELSGFCASAILSYGRTRSGRLRMVRHLVWPGLRTLPDETGSSFSYNFTRPAVSLQAGTRPLREILHTATIRGMLRLELSAEPGLSITRTFYPAPHAPALLEEVRVENEGTREVNLCMSATGQGGVLPGPKCKNGPYYAACGGTDESGQFSSRAPGFQKAIQLKPGESTLYYSVYYAVRGEKTLSFSITEEIEARKAFIQQSFESFRLNSPLPELNAQFSHCVLRGSESIFETPRGLMHGPGGGNYYAALWTNDQCEYANPFFPFSGYSTGMKQAENCYHLFYEHMDQSGIPMEDKPPLVSSIISGGSGVWHGAGDRGDASMYAYGLGRFLLEMSDDALLQRFYPALVWSLSFALSRKNAHGVIDSDSDELENRFPSGDCNLSTSCLTYDALFSGVKLAQRMGDEQHAALWGQERTALGRAIEYYFGDRVEGYETYRYYDGNNTLRAWICMPLTVGLFDRAEETVRALFSNKLYSHGMLRTESRHTTTWDRSLLFALRGTFLAGYSSKGMDALEDYCHNRLLGSHAPYAFEAWPEGNRAHLAAENLLFARVVTEGLWGLQVIGWRLLRIAPKLSPKCPYLELEGLSLFGMKASLRSDAGGITITFPEGRVLHVPESKALWDAQAMTLTAESNQ